MSISRGVFDFVEVPLFPPTGWHISSGTPISLREDELPCDHNQGPSDHLVLAHVYVELRRVERGTRQGHFCEPTSDVVYHVREIKNEERINLS